MNARTEIQATTASGPGHDLLRKSVPKLDQFVEELRPIRKSLNTIIDLGDDETTKVARRNLARLNRLEPSVTMIGQIKSGKTSLVNAMIGLPDLLPADVNPWTSVVTSLHMRPDSQSSERSAVFKFFENDEWDRLVRGGGRVGELADRAGADEEMVKIKAQIAQMREKSKERLGRKFEMLLGQHHEYGYFDQELIERYVCLGDDFDDEQSNVNQGRFADITRSADFYFQQPAFPMRLCIRDTPGVNDTFMMREQITIRAIRDSRICVVLLSAHQALSSTDLALIRLISNVKSREVIIFVNRIDELSDPNTQVPQIRSSIATTLSKHNGPQDCKIIFGCALWAQKAMTKRLSELPEASKEALLNWAEFSDTLPMGETDPGIVLWHLSGLPALFDAISERAIEGVGQETLAQIVASTRNLINSIRITEGQVAKIHAGSACVHLDEDEIEERLAIVESQSTQHLAQALETHHSAFSERIDRAHRSFLQRATEALITHLENYGENESWEYDPSGLRMLLSSSYKAFGAKCRSAFADGANFTIQEHVDLYRDVLHLPAETFKINAPPAPRIPAPVSLGQTIVLDIKGSWWKKWWVRRRGYQAFASDFYELIKGETESFIADLKSDAEIAIQQVAMSEFQTFVSEQAVILRSATCASPPDAADVDHALGMHSQDARLAALQAAEDNLERYLIDD